MNRFEFDLVPGNTNVEKASYIANAAMEEMGDLLAYVRDGDDRAFVRYFEDIISLLADDQG